MKKSIYRCFGLLCILGISLGFTSCKLGRFAYYNFANITDHDIFPTRTAHTDSIKFHYPVSLHPKVPKGLTVNNKEISFDQYLAQSNTVAFLIIRNDSIYYENYFNGYNEKSVVASFSMAKSVTSILIGCAIDEGLIKSTDEPMVNYIPELNHDSLEKVTIQHLLDMQSGIHFNESYSNPFGDAASYYYGTNLRRLLNKRKLDRQPGGGFDYSSGDTQLLGLVLERALKGKTITAYLEEKLWKPLGMEYDATWSLDREKNGLEKTFCCINARARDFAKIGRLYLNRGNWNGKQIVSSEWVKKSTAAKPGSPHYSNQWWLNPDGSYMSKGILGQYIYVNPAKDLIMVRLGKSYGNTDWVSVFNSLSLNY